MSRTDLLCRALRASGALAGRAAALRVMASRGFTVLAYHRVLGHVPDEPVFDTGVVSCTAGEFEREMRFVGRYFDVISFDEIGRGGLDCRNPLIVTFDDGYRDNHDIALPILLRTGVKATFFISTGYVDSRRLPWWDEVAWLVRHCRGGALRLSGGTFQVALRPEQDAAIAAILTTCKSIPDAQRLALIDELRSLCAGPSQSEVDGVMMRWSEVRQLAEAGMEIGSHTVSHPVLGNLADAAAITAELAESRRRLQAETGRAVKVISYPVGRSTTVTGEVVRLAQDAGYAYGCVYQHGVNPKAGFDPFRLLRIKTEVGSDFDRFRAKVLFPAWVRY